MQRLSPRFPLGLIHLCVAVALLVLAMDNAHAQSLKFATPSPSGNSKSDPTNNPIPVPGSGKVYIGAHIDWNAEAPEAYATTSGLDLLGYGLFLPFPLSSGDFGYFQDKILNQPYPSASSDGNTRSQLMLTLEPVAGGLAMAANNASAVADVVAVCKLLNERGVSVFLRFAHEMNGWWSFWAMRPTAYKAAFRAIALGIQACKTCTATAMVWAPQVGVGYPWGLDIPLNQPGFFTANPGYGNIDVNELKTLDTNGDGKIASGDEPYEPYWPGDDVVDWVGLSIYYAGRNYGEPSEPWPTMFSNGLQGFDFADGVTVQAPNFYQIYCVSRKKPFTLAETSLMHIKYDSLGTAANATRLKLKQDWWRQTINATLFDQFPNYRSTWLFEFAKEDTIPGVIEDFSYTFDAATRAAFKADLPTSRMVFGRSNYVNLANYTSSLSTLRTSGSSGSPGSPPTSNDAPTKIEKPYILLRVFSSLVIVMVGGALLL
ncbi:glycoside hydrolase family 26 protein [Gonapodya prolifera JEL478]|uniref:Glycoside hydrolase family 26 protein n=1 Tax=Gonapodya prolifera (strain JEL478) TaxID=1344416 RepID=A0A139AM75_GONPJ|nr:glycoside hydrolase family 26 protein [Gonapodya prolifera JEL478]|eukprot:KXS17862.1 glycoside hydrolase family 26 protein [Gonapodya prolifera JEL478]